MQRFFVESYQVLEEEHRITLTGPDLNHMKNVLRMRIGEDVWISDGSEKEYHCTIEEFQEDSAVLPVCRCDRLCICCCCRICPVFCGKKLFLSVYL